MPEYAGACLCGAIRWRTAVSPFWSAHCHCVSCRRATGAPVASFMGFGKSAVHWNGQRQFYRSSPGVTRGFCASCGTPLSYMSTRWPGEIHLYAATLNDPSVFKPEAHVHWSERVPYLTVTDELPKHAGSSPGALPSQQGEKNDSL